MGIRTMVGTTTIAVGGVLIYENASPFASERQYTKGSWLSAALTSASPLTCTFTTGRALRERPVRGSTWRQMREPVRHSKAGPVTCA